MGHKIFDLLSGSSGNRVSTSDCETSDWLKEWLQLKLDGNQHYSRKDYNAAKEYYTRGIDLVEQDLAKFYQNRAACNEALGKYEEAVADCGLAINLKKFYTKAYSRRARAYSKLGKYDLAVVDAYSANFLEDNSRLTNRVLVKTILDVTSRVKGAEAIKKHKPCWPSNQVIKTYFSLFTHDPINEKINVANIRTPEQLEPLYLESKKPENGNDPFHLSIKGSCLSLMGQESDAMEVFDRILALSDDVCSPRTKVYALLKKSNISIDMEFSMTPNSSVSLFSNDNYMIYDELINRAIRLDPKNPDIFLIKGIAMIHLKNYDEALIAINKALSLKRDFDVALARKFVIEFEFARKGSHPRGKLQQILVRLKKAVEQYPNSRDISLAYARYLIDLEYYKQADNVLNNLIRLHPHDAASYVMRGGLQFSHMDDIFCYDCAASLLRKAIEMDPKLLESYEPLARIELARKHYEEVIKLLETAVSYSQNEHEYVKGIRILDEMKYSIAALQIFKGTTIW